MREKNACDPRAQTCQEKICLLDRQPVHPTGPTTPAGKLFSISYIHALQNSGFSPLLQARVPESSIPAITACPSREYTVKNPKSAPPANPSPCCSHLQYRALKAEKAQHHATRSSCSLTAWPKYGWYILTVNKVAPWRSDEPLGVWEQSNGLVSGSSPS